MTRIYLIIATLLLSSPAYADLLSPWRYIQNYQLGFDVGERRDSAEVGYDIDRGSYYNEKLCTPDQVQTNMAHCKQTFDNSTNNYGIFIEQAFKRHGLWHFDYDIAFDLRIIDSKLKYAGDTTDEAAVKAMPIQDMRLHLYSVVGIPYVTFGITPEHYPELLASIGPTGEMVWGSININDTRYQIAERGVFRRSSVSSFFSYMQLNLVLKRFGKGYFAITMSHTRGDDHVQDGNILPEQIDAMNDLSLQLNKEFFGLKVLLK